MILTTTRPTPYATLLAMVLAFLLTPSLRAQPQITEAQAATLQPLDPAAVPALGTFWILTNATSGTFLPPLPFPPPDMLGSCPIYDLGNGQFLIDASNYNPVSSSGFMATADFPPIPPGDGGGDGGGGTPDYKFNTNGLWLSITSASNQTAFLQIHNTTNGTPYEIISSQSLTNALTNWISEGIWIGLSTITPADIPLGTRTNQLFFDARVWTAGEFTNRPPTGGQLVLELSSTNAIQALVNGVSNSIAPFSSNYALINPPLYSLNLGYDASDGGSTNTPHWPEQNILGVAGFSSTLSNLCLSFNPLSRLDIHGFPALEVLECWHCTNLAEANITGCQNLGRVSFELCNIEGALDFTGDTNLADVRGAGNQYTNIVFGGAGPLIWHLCAHNNYIERSIDFSQFRSLQQLWFWDAGQNGALVLTSTNASTNLTSVQVYNDGQAGFANNFTSADFYGQLNVTDIEVFAIETLTNLNVAGCSNLAYLDAQYDSLPTAIVDSVLTNLDKMGLYQSSSHPYLLAHLYGNAAPSAVGLNAITNLLNKNWAVTWSPPPSNIPEISDLQVSPGSNTATITWNTQISSDSTVYYGVTTNYGNSATGNSNTTHSVALSGLTTDTVYYFYAASTSGTNTGTSTATNFTTLGGLLNTNAIYFVSTSQTVGMQVSLSGSATVSWHWGDGSNDTTLTPTHSFASAGTFTNFVTITPSSALAAFGAACPASTPALTSVSGLANYPSLQDVFFYETGLSQISLANCSDLAHVALAGCNVTSSTEDGWFNDLNTAEAAMPSGSSALCDGYLHYFFYPTNATIQPSSASATARTQLTTKGWTLYPISY